jgi:hypothetical protein
VNDHGSDVVSEQRLYQVIRQTLPVSEKLYAIVRLITALP